MKSPVLCIIFNRPETTRKVFEVLQKVKPPQLYIYAEGPRDNKPEDNNLCKETRSIYDKIDWECDVHRYYREKNSGGCGPGVSGAITWFFENVEEGIILEDDIVPHPEFFDFCDEMLEKYRKNEIVKCVCGDKIFYENLEKYSYSYYFSHYMHVWGWATWRRTWNDYDYTLKTIPHNKFKKAVNRLPISRESKMGIISTFNIMTSDNPIDTWDYQLLFNIIFHKGLTIIPTTNLCQNIGCGVEQATHTTVYDEKIFNHVGRNIFPLSHPSKIRHNKRLDKITFSSSISVTSQRKSLLAKLRHYYHAIRLNFFHK